MALHVLGYADVESLHDAPDRLARFAGLIESRRRPDTVLAGAGDDLAPGVLPLHTSGRAAVEFFERLAPDVDTLGNHEFDYGPDRALELIAAAPPTYVCANVRRDGDRFGADAGVVPSTTLRAGGETVGVVGVAAEDTPTVAPRARSLTVTDPVAAAEREVDRLRDRDVDRILVLSHCGDDEPLARALDVPLVLGGHRHDARRTVVDGTVLVRPGDGGRRVVEATVEDGAATVDLLPVADAPADDAVRERAEARVADLGLDRTVTRLPTAVGRDATSGESAVGDFLADALRDAADADCAVVNGGTVRGGDPLVGAVTAFDVLSLFPFENRVSAVELSGRRLRRVLREAGGAHLDWQSPERWHGQVAGVEFVYDHEADAVRSVRVDGDPLDPEATYEAATLATTVRPGGQFPSLDGEGTDAGHVHDALLARAERAGLPAEPAGRIQRVGVDRPAGRSDEPPDG